jgi:hypothetical protein
MDFSTMKPFRAVAILLTLLNSSIAFASTPTTEETKAHVALLVENKRDDGVDARSIRIEKFSSPGCSAPKTLVELFLKKNASEQMRKSITVPAGQPIGLTFSYLDDRVGETRSCAMSEIFTPIPGVTYQARFSITPGVLSCTISLLDQNSPPVESKQLPQVCTTQLKDFKGSADSGEGYVLKWNLRFRVKGIRNGT